MKHLSLTLLILYTAILSAQTDSVNTHIRTEPGPMEPQKVVNRYDEVFGLHEPARWLFKWDAASALPALGLNPQDVNTGGLRFDAEWKPGQAFSLNASYMLGMEFILDGLDLRNHGFRLEPRWYFGMRKRVREGRGASNLSGNYVGLELHSLLRAGKVEAGARTIYRSALARIGMQRRLFRYGFFDISYGIGLRSYPSTVYNRGGTKVFSDARIGVGLALARPKTARNAQAPGYCEVLQCFREERRMIKIDLFNLLRVTASDQFAGTARVALEQKIGDSPFSVELEGLLQGWFANYEYSTFSEPSTQKIRNFSYGAQLQGRYYYAQKRRIATGKSGNNLSGAYLALQGDSRWGQNNTTFIPASGNSSKIQSTSALVRGGLLWGIQYRLFEKGFIDFNFGAGRGQERITRENTGTYTLKEWHIMGSLRAGLAF